MELNEMVTLALVQKRITMKVNSFTKWAEFIVWLKAMTQAKFKAFILQCLDDVVSDGDVKKADLLEIKSLIEG